MSRGFDPYAKDKERKAIEAAQERAALRNQARENSFRIRADLDLRRKIAVAQSITRRKSHPVSLPSFSFQKKDGK